MNIAYMNISGACPAADVNNRYFRRRFQITSKIWSRKNVCINILCVKSIIR